jgi:anti-sigma regulatory factor (Ser/Thr protein kinase)
MAGTMTLEIPVDPAYAVTARLFVAAAARDLGAADGTIEDLRLAASELVANAVEVGEPGPVRLSLRADQAGGIHLDATGVGPLVDEPPISRVALLGALFDGTDLGRDGDVHILVTPVQVAPPGQA